jgi:aquaporin Z
VCLVFGLVVMAMISSFGHVSGAHINPAVTVAFWASGRFPARRVPGYVLAQCAGAIAASLLVRAMFPGSETLGATLPSGAVAQAFVMEVALSFVLMLVILSVALGPKEVGLFASIAIGGTVAFDALVGGPVSGASMNPARSLGPAVVGGEFAALWVYFAAPAAGMLLAIPAYRVTRASSDGGRSGRASPGGAAEASCGIS